MRRVGALLGAVAMVVAAFVVRDALSGDEGAGTSVASDSPVVCPIDLDAECDALPDRRPESLGVVADSLITADDIDSLDADTWVVPAAWARLIVDERARLGRPAVLEIGDVIAGTEVVLVVWDDRAEPLAATCGTVGWACLASQSGTALPKGDRVQAAMPDVDTAAGLVVAASQAGALLGTGDYAANDFDPTFSAAASALAAGQRADPLRTMRARGPGAVTAVGTLRADATNLQSTFGAIVPIGDGGHATRLDLVVLSGPGGGLASNEREALRDALLGAGWNEPADGPDGLPAGGVLAALRTLWNEI